MKSDYSGTLGSRPGGSLSWAASGFASIDHPAGDAGSTAATSSPRG